MVEGVCLLKKLPSNILLLPTSLVLTNDFQAQYDGEGGRDCQSVPRNVCRQVAVPNCRQIADEQCRQAPTRECGKVPREQCRQIPRYNCKQVKCTFASALKLKHTVTEKYFSRRLNNLSILSDSQRVLSKGS